MRNDSFRTGVILGLLAPVLGFVLYGLMYTNVIRPQLTFRYFVTDIFIGTSQYRAPILSLSLIADAFLFFWLDRTDKHQAMRGVIAAMLAYGVVIVILWI